MTTVEFTTRTVSPFLAIASAPPLDRRVLDYQASLGPDAAHVLLQLGPSYECFLCGAPAKGIQYWPVAGAGFSPLDAYAGSIGYLIPTCTCHQTHIGCTRVAVLDGLVMPLKLAGAHELPDWTARTEHNVAAVKAAIERLTTLQAAAACANDEAQAESFTLITIEEELARR